MLDARVFTLRAQRLKKTYRILHIPPPPTQGVLLGFWSEPHIEGARNGPKREPYSPAKRSQSDTFQYGSYYRRLHNPTATRWFSVYMSSLLEIHSVGRPSDCAISQKTPMLKSVNLVIVRLSWGRFGLLQYVVRTKTKQDSWAGGGMGKGLCNILCELPKWEVSVWDRFAGLRQYDPLNATFYMSVNLGLVCWTRAVRLS